ncbi:MAG: tetratricopeptide repeat protein [Halioglobus sp.]
MPRFLALATCLWLLSACATTDTPSTGSGPAVDASASAITETPEPSERAFPDDSLYPMLVAEFAIRRREFDVALDTYMTLAPDLQDAGVSAHTTNLGQYMQRYDDALESARLWVELEPDSIEANSTLASLLVRQGRAAEALPYLGVVERGGTHARFPALLAGYDDLTPQQQVELAAGIDELAAEFPDNTELLLTQALIFTEAQDYAQALEKLDRILELEPRHSTALIMEAEILLNQQARRPFARLEKALRAEPDDSELRMQYARMLTGTDLDAARKQFEILSAQAPGDADLLFSLALLNREIGDYDAASAYLEQVVELDTRVGEAYYYLGKMEEDRGRPLEAVPYYQLIEEGREFLPGNKRLAEILVAENRLDQLDDVFTAQRQRYPSLSEPLYGLEADVLATAGYTDEALARLDGGLQVIPQSTSLLYSRAMILEKSGDLEAMEADLRDILSREPDNATALNALGYTLTNRTDRHGEAMALITKALELEPNEPAILDSMGWVLYRKGRNQEALDYLTRAYAMFPDPEVAAHLGELLWVTGDTEGAMNIWQGAALRDPDHPTLTETMERFGVTLPGAGSGEATDPQ